MAQARQKAKSSKKAKGWTKGLAIALAVLLVLVVLQSLPVWILRDPGMETLNAPGLVIHCDPDDKGGALAAERLPERLENIREALGQDESPVELYLYARQSSLHLRKYGLITLLAAPEWYVGDNRRDVALAASPESGAGGYGQDELLQCALHEMVHCYNYRTNPQLSYFLDNGVACYLAEQQPDAEARRSLPAFPLALTRTEDEVAFGENGGYAYAYWYVEYLDTIYGWEAIRALLRGDGYESALGMSEEAAYDEWMTYMDLYYPAASMG